MAWANRAQESKGYELMEQADKRLKAFVMPLFGSKDAKFEDAAELFQKAGNAFKVAKNFGEAGAAHCKAAECHLELNAQHEAASAFNEAANAYKKADPDAAIGCLKRCIELFTDLGRFSQVAKHHKEVAEIYETQENLEGAIEHFQLAADFYSGEDATSSANQCLLKVAAFSAQLGKYDRAVQIYEEVASTSLESNLLKWSVKEYFQRALLCELASGDDNAADKARSKLEKYEGMDPSFGDTRECKLIKDILAQFDALDVEGFTQVVFEYDSVSKLDPWKTTVLLKVKNAIKESGDSLT